MPELSQTNRFLKFETPLGPDKFGVRSFSGEEEISSLFHFRVDLLSEESTIVPKTIVGKKATLSVLQADDSTERFFNGIVSRFRQLPSEGRYYRYQAEIVPWFWLLTLSTDCKIFQQKSIPDIIKEVFSGLGFTDFQMELKGQHTAWDYCVQYRESHFDFVTRLMEEEGIFYFFKHEKTKNTLVMADNKGVHQVCPFQDKFVIEPLGRPAGVGDEDVITHWERQYEYRPGKYSQTDYNFETPSLGLFTTVNTLVDLDSNKKFEVYDYPGEYPNKAEGDTLTKLRMEEEEVDYDVASGEGDCRSMAPGFKFTMQRHAQKDQNGTYVLTRVVHSAAQGTFEGEDVNKEAFYANSFRCIPQDVVYRPERKTAKPIVYGTQTAVVVGPKGEEIFTDKYGRVKVQFHWDRIGKKDDNSSCWVRVSQPWAGKAWGAMWIPRIGQEVVVDFQDGDPDCPLIVGRVYNADQTVPYALPGNQTQSGFKSRSSKGGGTDDFNEIRFEDKKGSEMFTVHAQKDMEKHVENDLKTLVEHDETREVQNDRTTTITKGNQKETIKMGNNTLLIEMGNMEATLKMGNKTTKLNLGKEEREAMQSIELKVGQSSVKLDQMGVTIKGMMIKIDGQIQVDVHGLMTNVKADAILMVKGGIVMIN